MCLGHLTSITRAWSYPIKGKKSLATHIKIQFKSELAHENQSSRFSLPAKPVFQYQHLQKVYFLHLNSKSDDPYIFLSSRREECNGGVRYALWTILVVNNSLIFFCLQVPSKHFITFLFCDKVDVSFFLQLDFIDIFFYNQNLT